MWCRSRDPLRRGRGSRISVFSSCAVHRVAFFRSSWTTAQTRAAGAEISIDSRILATMRLSQAVSQAESQPTPRPPRTRHLGALRHRNYRLFFGGQVVSTVGTWMQSIAQPWLVLQLTHSGFWVRVLLVTQACYMIPAFALFLVSATHVAQVWMVLLAAVAVGSINVFDMPTRQSFVIEMVGREDLMNAIALNSSVFNGASVLGPSVAGVLIGAVGVPICFFINSLSYLAALAALLL